MAIAMAAETGESEHLIQQSYAWTGEIWIQDHWSEEEKAKARDHLALSSRFRQQRQCQKGDVDPTNHPTLRRLHLHHEQRQQQLTFQNFRRNASTNWNVFYDQNKTNFFKDRHYLQKAFPNEFGWLYDACEVENNDDAMDIDNINNKHATNLSPPVYNGATKEHFRIVEIGCGVGNATLPLLEQYSKLMQRYQNKFRLSSFDEKNAKSLLTCPPQMHIHCLDFAPNAIHLLKQDVRFQSAEREGRATAHVYDVSSTHPSTINICNHNHALLQGRAKTHKLLANSADVAILLFCLSAIGPHPSHALRHAARNIIDMLRPGGTLVIRDYGRLDEGTTRMAHRACLSSVNFVANCTFLSTS
jgi:SAM-dependent methyltransferase